MERPRTVEWRVLDSLRCFLVFFDIWLRDQKPQPQTQTQTGTCLWLLRGRAADT